MRIAMGGVLAGVVLCLGGMAHAVDRAAIDDLGKEIGDLRKRIGEKQAQAGVQTSNVDRVLDGRCGCEGPAPVTTKSGKFTMGALVQMWYYGFQHDNRGLFDNAGTTPLNDSNQFTDNNGFRVRCTELYFTMDINENVSSFLNWDPARTANTFPLIMDNTANQSAFKRLNLVSPEFDAAAGGGTGSTSLPKGVQQGTGGANRSFKDAYVNYHGVVPHTDFQIGLFKPKLGEEGIRNAGELDFIERGFIGFIVDDITRDTGAVVHQTWWDDRFQYWAGVFNGVENFYGSESSTYLRAQDHDQLDYNYRVLVRPLWSKGHDCSCQGWDWGKMELGMSSKFGHHGGEGTADPTVAALDGLSRQVNWAVFHNAWFYYAFGSKLSGWWLRGEYGLIHDRNAPGTVADLTGAGGLSGGNAQSSPRPFTSQGYNASMGYKLSDSVFADSLCGWLKPLEFVGRYDQFQNVQVASQVDPSSTNVYKTEVVTGGINYYIKGHNAKVQANVLANKQPTGGLNNFHNVRNSAFVLQFQVYY